MLISIIIPTLNEEDCIEHLIRHLQRDPSFPLINEIIVVDGNSEDATIERATSAGAKVLPCKFKSRSAQMNLGAQHAEGQILYFLHADTYPPPGFAQKIWDAVRGSYSCGCFRLKFDWNHWFLNLNSWFTRFSLSLFRFGDQSLFVTREVFSLTKGFNDAFTIFEDQEFVARIIRKGSFRVLPDKVVTSARKYRKNGPFRLQLVYFWIYLLYSLGVSQKKLVKSYQSLVPFPMT